jgi:hypothetical protein
VTRIPQSIKIEWTNPVYGKGRAYDEVHLCSRCDKRVDPRSAASFPVENDRMLLFIFCPECMDKLVKAGAIVFIPDA